jgi:hypothetical protein
MKDKLFQSYHRKAGKIREEDQHDRTRGSDSKQARDTLQRRRDPYGFAVYWAMHGGKKTSSRKEAFIIGLLGGSSLFAAVYFFIATADWPVTPFLFNARIVTGTVVLAWLIYISRWKIYSIVTYPAYINWYRKIHCRLSGWEDLVSSRNFTNPRFWRNGCSISITAADTTEEFKKGVQSIFYIFCHRTRPVYGAYESKDSEPWSYTGLTLRGRCNCTIAGQIYSMIKKRPEQDRRGHGRHQGNNHYLPG